MKVGVAEAAEMLGVSPQRVRAMIAADRLDAEQLAGRWLVESASFPTGQRRSGQPYSPRMAWALMTLADGQPVPHLSQSEQSRLRSRWQKLLGNHEAATYLPALLSRRGRKMRMSAPEPDALLEDPRFVRSGRSDLRSGMSVRGYAEGYVRERDLAALKLEYFLVRAHHIENTILRVIPESIAEPPRAKAPWLALVTDLAEGGPRELQQAQGLWHEQAIAANPYCQL